MNISVNHISAGYGGKQVLKDVSISFESGQLTGIIGPNGCGKRRTCRIGKVRSASRYWRSTTRPVLILMSKRSC